jgi:serine protease Do
MRISPKSSTLRGGLFVAFTALLAATSLAIHHQRASASELRFTPLVRAIEKAVPSIVNIRGRKTVPPQAGESLADGARRVNGMGTGVIIDERGYILTNFHVVDGVSRIHVTMHDGETHIASLVSGDPSIDLAVIKISSDEPFSVITIGTSSDLMLGETVVAIGNAYGYPTTVTEGIISALHRTVEVSDTQKYEDLIQTDASINPGNSGGPLLNIDGEMIGLNAAVRIGAQGIGFAIPIDNALAMAARLLTAERLDNHWHGITGRSTGEVSDRRFVVESVVRDSPSDKAGLQVGDAIVKVGNLRVERALDFERALIGQPTGKEVPVTIRRNGQSRQLSLVMTTRSPRPSGNVADEAWSALGMRLQSVPASQFRRLSTRYRGGLKVIAVRDGSPADRQGIRSGDVLVGMHIWETISMENVAYILRHANSTQVKFYILRGDETLYGHLPVAMRNR